MFNKKEFSKNVSTNSNNSKNSTFRAKHLSRYKYPTPNEVPPGKYISEIIFAQEKETKTGKKAVEIFCELKPSTHQFQDTRHFVKQCYTFNTQYFEDFLDAMSAAVGTDDLDYPDFIGVTEQVTLAYRDFSNFGTFKEREPISIVDDNTDENSSCTVESETTSSISETRSSLLADDDDDFDDFLDDEE